MNRCRISLAVALFVFLSPMAPSSPAARGGDTWQSAHAKIRGVLKGYRRLQGRTTAETESRPILRRLDQALETALSARTPGPRQVTRIKTILPYVQAWSPEAHHLIYGLFSSRVGAAIQQLEEDELEAFATYARQLWKTTSRRTAEKTTLERMIVATSLRKLIKSPTRDRLLIELAHHLLGREIAWVRPLAKKPVSLTKAIKVLGTRPESTTIYPVLEAVERVYEVAFQGDPHAVLAPFVTELIHLLEKIEVRVEGRKRGEFLAADDDRSASQLRLWFRVTAILQKWTGEVQYVWFADWLRFWELYFGPHRTQKPFDFARVTRGAADAGTTRVVAKTDSFFGIEARTSKFLIILDVSSSMDRNTQNIDRFTPLKKEAIRFITSLKPGVHYNILPFSSTSDIGRSLTRRHELQAKRLPRGKISDRTRNWINNLKTEAFTRVDLAFRAAFSAPRRVASPRTASRGFRPTFNEIYFITDGSPTNAQKQLMGRDEILDLLSLIRGLNARHKVIIHTVGFRGMDGGFIRRLGQEHGGKTTTIGI